MRTHLSILVALSIILCATAQVCDFTAAFCNSYNADYCEVAYLNEFTFPDNSSQPAYLYDVISLAGDITLLGSIQGRAACRYDFYSNGSASTSVGAQLRAADGNTPYALIAGQDVYWTKGNLGPAGEGIFAGASFHGSSQLARRVSGHCPNGSLCLFNSFHEQYRFWTYFSNDAAAYNATVNYTLDASGHLHLTCHASTQKINAISIPVDDFNKVTSYSVNANCNQNSIWLFNVHVDNENVATRFNGQAFPVSSSTQYVIYNIISYTKVVTAIRDVLINGNVNGNIVAAQSNINQLGGHVNGQVIGLSIGYVTDMRRPRCPA